MTEKSFGAGGRGSLLYSGGVMIAAALLIFIVTLAIQWAFGIFFTPMLTEFGWTKAMTAGAFSISWVVHGILGIMMGRLCDRFGARWILTLAGFLLGGSFMALSTITDVWQFYLFYGLFIGAGMGCMWVPIMSSLTKRFTKNRNIVMAIVMGGGGGGGTVIGPPLANWLITLYDWRLAYVIMGGVTLGVMLVAAQFIRHDLIAPPVVNPQAGQFKLSSGAPRSLTLKQAMVTRQFWMHFIEMTSMGFCAYIIVVHIVTYAIESRIDATTAASILAASGGATLFSRLFLGALANRVGSRSVLIIGMALMFGSSFWLISSSSVNTLFLIAAIFGFGFGAGVSNPPLVVELFGVRSNGVILGGVNLGYSLGSAGGPLVAGYLYDVTGSYQIPFLICTLVGLAGLFAIIFIRPLQGD